MSSGRKICIIHLMRLMKVLFAIEPQAFFHTSSHIDLPTSGAQINSRAVDFLLPWSQRFFLIILRERDQEQTAKRRQRVAKATRRERKTSGYLGLESHFHADDRVRI